MNSHSLMWKDKKTTSRELESTIFVLLSFYYWLVGIIIGIISSSSSISGSGGSNIIAAVDFTFKCG